MFDIQDWIVQRRISQSEPATLPGLPLVSERVRIVPFTCEDEERRQRWAKYTEPYFAKYNFSPQSPAVNKRNFLRLQDRVRLAIEDHAAALIGYISLQPQRLNSGAAELGICLAADQTDRGYGREALSLVLPWSVEYLGCKCLILQVDEVNLRAIRLYQRLGFRKVATLWKRENNDLLKEYLIRAGTPGGYRWKRHHLEVLSWIMEWKPENTLGS